MASTSSRTLRLLSLLQSRRHWPGPLLAGRLGVSARTLRRDVERLRELGYPVDAHPGVDGGYALARAPRCPRWSSRTTRRWPWPWPSSPSSPAGTAATRRSAR